MIKVRFRDRAPEELTGVSVIRYEVGEHAIEIRLQPDGSVYVMDGGLDQLSVDPVSANGVVIRHRRRR